MDEGAFDMDTSYCREYRWTRRSISTSRVEQKMMKFPERVIIVGEGNRTERYCPGGQRSRQNRLYGLLQTQVAVAKRSVF